MFDDNPQENNKIPQNLEAQNFRKSHWTIDKGIEDGQISAGEVDKEHVEFLKKTEFVKEEVKQDGR